MPAVVALALCILFVLWALRIDAKLSATCSPALWIPVVWVMLLASRPIASWFDPGYGGLEASPEGGNTLDRTLLLSLMCGAFVILYGRRSLLHGVVHANVFFFLFLMYCGLSVVWSEFPAVAGKRWVRALGSVAMVLVVLTEPDPDEAVRALIRRCAYVLVPLSVVLFKYYPNLGMRFDFWTGVPYIVGVATDKNALGRLCMVSALFLIPDLIRYRRDGGRKGLEVRDAVLIGVPALTVWLLIKAHSATALGSFAVGCLVFAAFSLPVMRRNAQKAGVVVILSAVFLLALDQLFDLANFIVVDILERNMTFTDRVYVWQDLLATPFNPWIGVGYDSFWLGERLQYFIQQHQVNHAHNGYLEVYIDLGASGLTLFLAFLLATFRKAKRALLSEYDFGRQQMTILFVYVVYNFTEPAYKATTFLFVVLLLVALQLSRVTGERDGVWNTEQRAAAGAPAGRFETRSTRPSAKRGVRVRRIP